MKRILVTKLEEGMIVSEDVYVSDNQVLIPKDVVLTKNIIQLLQHNQVLSIKVEDEQIEQTIFQSSSHIDYVRSTQEFAVFQRNYENAVSHISCAMNDLVEKNIAFDVNQFQAETLELMKSTGQSVNVLDFLISMRNYDDSTYCHSINVALLCGLFADWLHLSQNQKEIAMMCGLFHDIGKLQVPISIIQKPGSLTEEEFDIIKKHSEYGYHILCRDNLIANLDEHVKFAALMHHEKCDGSGYPDHLKAHQIDYYAKIVAICDVYDAMTSARVYRKPLCPFTVISHFEDEGLQKYDPELLLPFLDHVVNTYINHSVKLSNGQVGNIIFINKVSLSKPTIKCEDDYIDLSKSDNIYIEKIL